MPFHFSLSSSLIAVCNVTATLLIYHRFSSAGIPAHIYRAVSYARRTGAVHASGGERVYRSRRAVEYTEGPYRVTFLHIRFPSVRFMLDEFCRPRGNTKLYFHFCDFLAADVESAAPAVQSERRGFISK